MEDTHRATTQKLLQKFPKVRRWRPRHANSESNLGGPPTTEGESKSTLYSLKSFPGKSGSDMSPEQCAHILDQALVSGLNEDLDREPLVEFAASPAPECTPVPIPKRISSARAARIHSPRQNESNETKDRYSSESRKRSDETDTVSFCLSGLEEDLPPGPSRDQASVRGRPRPRTSPPPPPKAASSSRTSSKARKTPSTHELAIPRSARQSQKYNSPGLGISEPKTADQEQHLPALQNPRADRNDVEHTELNNVDDPESWDLLKPTQQGHATGLYSLEERAELLYNIDHLGMILDDPKFRVQFSNFLRKHRPWRLPILGYYWKSYKAIKALQYTNSLIETLHDNVPTCETAFAPARHAANAELMTIAAQAAEELRRDDLHYFIAHQYVQIVSVVVQQRIMGTLAADLQETSQGLAEVFCVTDPTRPNNPIILASQEFTRHSGCNLNYILGRNCNFLQGPATTLDSRRRFAISCADGRDHTEILVNYRRDGSPFLSLVMNAPLIDSRGRVRYFLGAQVDVSGLLKECSGLPSLQRLVDQRKTSPKPDQEGSKDRLDPRNEIKALSQLFNSDELEIIRQHGGYMLQGSQYNHSPTYAGRSIPSKGRRVLVGEGVGDGLNAPKKPLPPTPPSPRSSADGTIAGSLEGIYKHYLLVRPYPSLRILFSSPSLRAPGLLQSHLFHRIGGGRRLREGMEVAFREGNAVTAKVNWLDVPDEQGEGKGRTRWLHCTPLMHFEEKIGMWMVVIVSGDE